MDIITYKRDKCQPESGGLVVVHYKIKGLSCVGFTQNIVARATSPKTHAPLEGEARGYLLNESDSFTTIHLFYQSYLFNLFD